MPNLLSPNGTREGGIRCNYSGGVISREEDWHYNVMADDRNQDRSAILFSTPGLPLIGVTVLNGMLCVGGDAQRDPDNALLWRVSLTFSTDVGQDDPNNNGNQQGGDPTLWVPVRRTMWEYKEETSDTDASGNPIVNTADVPYETRMVRRRKLPVWEFTQFEPLSVTDDIIVSRQESTNNATWPTGSGRAAKTWLCTVIDSSVGFFAGFRCRVTTYRLVYDFKKWTDKRPSIGYLYKSSSNRFPYVVRGQVIQGPLTSTGDRVLDESGATIAGRTAAISEFDLYPSINFNFIRI